MLATLDHIENVAANIKTFWFKPEKPVRYEAGQFTELWLPHVNADERGEKRWFTLSSAPTEQLLSVTTKFTPVRSSTFKKTLLRLPIGAEITLADPMGDFVLPKDASIPLIFVAAGIGITPVRSIMQYLHDAGEHRDMHLLYGAPAGQESAFAELFENHSLSSFKRFISQSLTSKKGVEEDRAFGRISVQNVWPLAATNPHSFIYLSGPEAFVERFAANLQNHGVAPSRIISDFFHGY